MFFLFNIIFSIAATVLDMVVGFSIISGLYGLAMLIPSLAVAVRRLHDIGKSGWYVLVALIPIVGVIWLIVLLATEGTAGSNEYGENPKEVAY
jgi:uncharacterized membrane protein YhaH (DUF805 family)